MLDQAPSFSPSARQILQGKDGPASFQNEFGDYYICGYELGGDAGACMSASAENSATKEKLALTVAVKALFMKTSYTHTESRSSSTASSSLTMCGFSTLGQKWQAIASTENSLVEQAQLQQAAAAWLANVASLDSQIRAQMSQLGLRDGQMVRLAECGRIFSSGLVVSLLLAPFARLNEYAHLI